MKILKTLSEADVENTKNKGYTSTQRAMVILCSLVYFVSYLTRKNYAAVIAEFDSGSGVPLGASLALTGLAIFYGAGQLVSGYLGDRINPKYLIACGLFTTAAMNIALPFCTPVPLLVAVWCINGLAQAMMWPPIVKLLSSAMSTDDYKRSTVTVSNASQMGVILLYLLVPVCITYSSWKIVFFISGGFAAVAAFFVLSMMPRIKMQAPKPKADLRADDKGNETASSFPYILFGLIMITIVLQGIMRDGVADWLPTYLKSEFSTSSQLAILLGVAPPIFAMACFTLVSYLSRKVFKNELAFAGLIFTVAFVSSCALALFPSSNIVLSTVLSTLVNGCMHGANLILVCLVPPFFKRNGRISLVSGLLNSCTYVGSALSGYGFALLAKLFGWGGTIIGWAIICAVAAVICFSVVGRWQQHKNAEN